MGEIAEMMLDGTLDFETGEYLGNGCGYPRTAKNRQTHANNFYRTYPKLAKDTKCPICQKMVRGTNAVHQHLKDKHHFRKKYEREAILAE